MYRIYTGGVPICASMTAIYRWVISPEVATRDGRADSRPGPCGQGRTVVPTTGLHRGACPRRGSWCDLIGSSEPRRGESPVTGTARRWQPAVPRRPTDLDGRWHVDPVCTTGSDHTAVAAQPVERDPDRSRRVCGRSHRSAAVPRCDALSAGSRTSRPSGHPGGPRVGRHRAPTGGFCPSPP